MLCPNCGQPIRPGSRLCNGCGMWLIEEDARQAPPRQTPPTQPQRPTMPPPTSTGTWAPPNAAQRVDQPAPGGYDPFAAFTAPVIDDSVDEATTLSARRSKQPSYWTLTLPNGNVELVTDRPIIVGRAPEFLPALPQARLMPVPDNNRSVSKNHACFSMYGAALVVEDLGSTNGVIVTRADGREHDIGVGGRTELEMGDRVELGDAVVVVGRA